MNQQASHTGAVVGQVLRDRYVLEERLGAGRKGSVFKARDRLRSMLPEDRQYVALKVLNAAGEGDSSAPILTSLRQEFYCGQVLSSRNVVKVFDIDRDGDVLFFTMELFDGETLRNVMQRLRPAAMRRSQAWQLIQQLGAGLAHAHERGVVHGDLTPKNIVITREGELRIRSFGVSGSAGASSPAATRAYASCEQLEGREADPCDDLYALACICYELLSGRHPFESRAATLARDYRVDAARPEGLTARQWRALQRGLSWHRAGRAISVQLWMQRLLGDRGVKPQSVTPLQELTHLERVSSKMPWTTATLSLIAASLIAAVFLTQPRSMSAPAIGRASIPEAVAAEHVDGAAFRGIPTSAKGQMASPSSPVVTQATASEKSEGDAAPPSEAPRPMPLVFSVEPSQVRSDDHFAEIRLSRSLLQKGASFTWWTEPATAKPDVDYVSEAATVQAFPSGYRSTHLYVKLMPQPLRSHRSYFYIAISQPGHHGRATVTRRQVWLPMASSLQARR